MRKIKVSYQYQKRTRSGKFFPKLIIQGKWLSKYLEIGETVQIIKEPFESFIKIKLHELD